MKWITSKRLTIDRMAYPWRASRMLEITMLSFICVPKDKVIEQANVLHAILYDMKAKLYAGQKYTGSPG